MSDAAAFVEGFALELNQSGMQRMAARVFSALLLAPQDGYTAREIAETLDVSPAAVSGATAYLTRTRLAVRRRLPGERVDRFVVLDTTWAEAMATETQMIRNLTTWLGRGLEAVDSDSAAHQRLAATRDFFDYMSVEMPKLVARWHEERNP